MPRPLAMICNGTQDATSPAIVAVEASSLIIFMVGAALANSVAICITLRTRSLRSHAHNLLILNLNVADLGISLFTMPFSLASVFDRGCFLRSRGAACKANGFLTLLFTIVVPMSILAICVERFLAVVLSQRFPPSKRRVFVFIAFSWSSSLLLGLMPLTGATSMYRYHPSTFHCSPSWSDPLFNAFGMFTLVALTPGLILFYIAIVFYLRKVGLRLKRTRRAAVNGDDRPTGLSNSAIQRQSNVPAEAVESDANGPSSISREHTTGAYSMASKKANDDESTTKRKKGKVSRQHSFSAQIKQWKVETRVAAVGAVLVMALIFCWMPYMLVHLNFIPVGEGHWFGVTTMWLAFANSLLDPMIYTFMDRRARAQLKKYARRGRNSFRSKTTWRPS
ncbi:5-hydroxytryptamine receptor-like [Diadema antillarum]|uniref:5-hydroxytryptamine receptor-like n=1 Tax=Diadema antillarum TaxID=105358 RepID=UPI003A8B00C6